MAYHQFANKTEHFGSFETFFAYDSSDRPNGWYWWACFPGCLPDGDASGPFENEHEAIKNATDYI
jgi:hypothetical protein